MKDSQMVYAGTQPSGALPGTMGGKMVERVRLMTGTDADVARMFGVSPRIVRRLRAKRPA